MSVAENNTNNLSDFFKEEYESLKGYVRSRIENTSDSEAEDIIQDVALRIFSRPSDLLPISNVAGFVYRALSNKVIDVMRTRKEKIRDEAALEERWSEFAGLFYESEKEVYSEQLQRKLRQVMLELKPEYRFVILAIDFEGYTYAEVASETGIPPGTLMSRRHRALSVLLKKLNPKM